MIFYQIIDRQTLRDDHARRVAELLIVGERMHALAPANTAKNMTTRHLLVEISGAPSITKPKSNPMLADIADRIVAWEPSLAGKPLILSTTAQRGQTRNLAGSLQLDDGMWLNFQSRDISTMWPVAWRAMVLTLLLTAAFLCIGLVALYLMGKPLRRLTDAAETIGQGRQVTISESGPKDLRDLAHSMNVMQERIDRLLRDQASAFEAIGHDLRTPLARQKMAAEMVRDEELRGMLEHSADEMIELLDSLAIYLRSQHLTAAPETVDLACFITDECAAYGDAVSVTAPNAVSVKTFREPLALALGALVENAVQYAGSAAIALRQEAGDWVIEIADSGPGMAEEYFQPVLEPFFRLDEARQRNTKGFGLGIPTAHRLMMRFNGALSFSSPEGRGLTVRITVPQAR
nr:HAMP domain-containing sensor histidine kinase [Altericroceibacterium endophyticum]